MLLFIIAVIAAVLCSAMASYAAYSYWHINLSNDSAERKRNLYVTLNKGILIVSFAIFFVLAFGVSHSTALYFVATYFLVYFLSYKFLGWYIQPKRFLSTSPRQKVKNTIS